jgi:hypothetical protein
MSDQPERPMSPIVRRTILANNAIDALRIFYADALSDAYDQQGKSDDLVRQIAGRATEIKGRADALQAELVSAREEQEHLRCAYAEVKAWLLNQHSSPTTVLEELANLARIVRAYDGSGDVGVYAKYIGPVVELEPVLGSPYQG